ncbi:DNA-binding protein [Candidatus Competibacter phosphatis]|uniref:DNA-binding protein n=1 Tax=Candidatus Competibacter phosphatis TaxID=221280 RepID=A0ABX1TQP8_9GAMM|nr:helix-turn-helix domain-containing protein [Candidatus Competibacter phosphatis]NMQ20987.1 DNA-binding protein [Candidatus Competibacter phosphatis]
MQTPTKIDPLLTPEQTAANLGVSEKTLNVWRCTGRVNLPYVKVGARVRYRSADVEAFITRRTIRPGALEATQ